MMIKSYANAAVAMLSIFLLPNKHQVEACTCPQGQTFETQIEASEWIDAMYIFGQIKLNANDVFAGFVDPNDPVDDINADIYYLGYNWKSWKDSCTNPNTSGTYNYIVTGGNSAACGVVLTPGWYALGSVQDYVDPFTGTGNPNFKRTGSCDINIPWSSLTWEKYNALENILPTPCLPPTEAPTNNPTVGGCRDGNDCDNLQLCFAEGDPFCGACQNKEACSVDADCIGGLGGTVCDMRVEGCLCNGSGPGGNCNSPCTSDAQCGTGHTCNVADGHCAATACSVDADCIDQFACVGGSCGRRSCVGDVSCAVDDGFCVKGRCQDELGFCSFPPP